MYNANMISIEKAPKEDPPSLEIFKDSWRLKVIGGTAAITTLLALGVGASWCYDRVVNLLQW